jgi:hypothetical protein
MMAKVVELEGDMQVPARHKRSTRQQPQVPLVAKHDHLMFCENES